MKTRKGDIQCTYVHIPQENPASQVHRHVGPKEHRKTQGEDKRANHGQGFIINKL
jgi:hypothetical protein